MGRFPAGIRTVSLACFLTAPVFLVLSCSDSPRAVVGGEAAAPKLGDARKNPVDEAEMVYVPSGEFVMGDELGSDDERPARRVRITRGYWIYRTEVTNAQYLKFVQATGHRKPDYSGDVKYNAPQQPVVGVSWDDAAAYCKWAGVRLPTEAQWEYAARGPEGRKYPWGSEEPDTTRAVFFPAGKPASVGSLPAGASPCGALDMAGNVRERCADWYGRDYYKSAPPADPPGAATGTYRVVRGGSWFDVPSYLRASDRLDSSPGFRTFLVGFRPAQTD